MVPLLVKVSLPVPHHHEYVQQVCLFATNYAIFVASINGDGAVGPENINTIYGEYHIISTI